MNNLRDSIKDHKKTVTLSGEQITFIMNINRYMQQQLDMLQERLAAECLRYMAVNDFGMDPNKDFNFEFHPERESDNLTITEKIVGKR